MAKVYRALVNLGYETLWVKRYVEHSYVGGRGYLEFVDYRSEGNAEKSHPEVVLDPRDLAKLFAHGLVLEASDGTGALLYKKPPERLGTLSAPTLHAA